MVQPSVSPWRSPCTSKVNDSLLGGTFVRWEESALPCSLLLDEEVERQSTCELEVDGVAADVLNRLEIEGQIGRNPGLQGIWEDEKQRRRQNNQASQIETPESQDRGFIPSTESEALFMTRLKDLLKQQDFDVTQNPPPADGQDSEDFPLDFTLHLDPASQDSLTCSPATAVELHRDSQSGSTGSSVKPPEEAVVDEEAILSLLESSQTFLPASQTSHHSSLLDSSQDRAFVQLLAGLENDGFCGGGAIQSSQSLQEQQQRSGAASYQCNSDEEEAQPELEEEEAEMSRVMSQRWDSENVEKLSASRPGVKAPEDCVSDQQQDSSSDEDMDWSGNSSLFANLSIPQLDGAADESSDSSLTDSGSRTKSSLVVAEKLLRKRRNPFPGQTLSPEHQPGHAPDTEQQQPPPPQ